MKATKEAIQATQQSVDHWKRTIEWAREQYPKSPTDYLYMTAEIGEDWYSGSCPLCKCFLQPDTSCSECPLKAVFGRCDDPLAVNAWPDIRRSRTWSEWLEAAEVMLFQLETVLKLLKEADNA